MSVVTAPAHAAHSQPPPSASIELKIQNVVASCRITNEGTKLDLRQLAQTARNAEYNPKRFAAVVMRLRDPKATALIFESGKMVCLGAKDTNQAKIAGRKFAKIVKLCAVADHVNFRDWKVSNMVAVCNCGFPIRLEALHLSHIKFSAYEPELFPGLIYRLANPKIVLLIFVSGKVVLTGAKSREDLRAGLDRMFYILYEHRKETLSTAPPPTPSSLPSSSSSSSSST
mmetsp:Transcript_48452/g.110035  ORF Transcript_48452/g.110035 Transcript_48452/m.110035 type:complete len:228 (-) Transcript_48452:156-839(-)